MKKLKGGVAAWIKKTGDTRVILNEKDFATEKKEKKSEAVTPVPDEEMADDPEEEEVVVTEPEEPEEGEEDQGEGEKDDLVEPEEDENEGEVLPILYTFLYFPNFPHPSFSDFRFLPFAFSFYSTLSF